MNENDALCLQSDIDKLENWAKLWLMNFHPGKCHNLTIGKFENIQHAHQYKVCNQNIEHIDVEKGIRVQIDEELSYRAAHVYKRVLFSFQIKSLYIRAVKLKKSDIH
jgi:hypothetical protein